MPRRAGAGGSSTANRVWKSYCWTTTYSAKCPASSENRSHIPPYFMFFVIGLNRSRWRLIVHFSANWPRKTLVMPRSTRLTSIEISPRGSADERKVNTIRWHVILTMVSPTRGGRRIVWTKTSLSATISELDGFSSVLAHQPLS